MCRVDRREFLLKEEGGKWRTVGLVEELIDSKDRIINPS
jgi:hypothetical protein